MTLLLRSLTTLVVGWLLLLCPVAVFAQAKATPAQIRFDSLTAIYHLSRDKKGLSLLTTEETIVADFPGNASYYGITRSIPKNYQNHSVNVKVLGVSDAAGDVIPFKTSTDTNDNIVVTTGDPSITLYGSQTIKIRYQTSGVVNLKNKSDEFLLNVNGRGCRPSGTCNETRFCTLNICKQPRIQFQIALIIIRVGSTWCWRFLLFTTQAQTTLKVTGCPF
jgi:hypothetical protein